MNGVAFVPAHCPYCGEPIELITDASAGDQDYIEDCAVCCRPMRVRVWVDVDGEAHLAIAHEDDA